MSGVSLISDDMRAAITRNYVASEREARFASFHFMAFVLVALVALGALVVDYMIVSEFWTRALANEFLELPGALGSSVAFKSMQVLFATVAAHILYEQLGPMGKALFVRIVFMLALTMLLGVGLLLALMSLPNGIAATSDGSVGSSLGNALAGLGITTEATQETARTTSEIDQMRGWQPMAWLASLGIVFLVVTGVAALCLHYAVSSLRRVFHARDFKYRRAAMERLASLEAEHDGNRHSLSEMEGPENRRHLLWTGLMRECRSYEQGLDEARREGNKISQADNSGVRGLLGRRRQAPVLANDAQSRFADRLKACEDSRCLGRYEKLFDDWWERRSRNAMKAGPARLEPVREPISEVIPPRSALRIPTGAAGE
ncbi:hypothetical protein [Parvibaculum sp.]|jgi:hypothetical protein|uniref:hypothetical protein n=1 Tax=Parvibaculum sp. TaxID=2024848 RepID=UPI000C65DC9B|nr:hypothetical protein [Parvibaculum sp.]MAM93126.1 hypothetical protein [Parvibaculum sp.]HCX67211.1 hypothetical protein [Rhodobiaceae bacterium]|tara:strand:+ start:26338 stop:27456 length:1119 start_codon:yes stop_codon:yes gene_type:complete